jgi:hypothetical protein
MIFAKLKAGQFFRRDGSVFMKTINVEDSNAVEITGWPGRQWLYGETAEVEKTYISFKEVRA